MTKPNWARHKSSAFPAYLRGMKINEYRWQDFVISRRRARVELIAAALVLAALTIGVITFDDRARDAHWQAAGASSLHNDAAPQLAAIAKQRIVPRGTYGL